MSGIQRDEPDPGFDWREGLALPRRARLAFALASARRVSDRLPKDARIRKVAGRARQEGWRWILRTGYRLDAVEDEVEPQLLGRRDATPAESDALQTHLVAVHLLYACAGYPAAVFQDPPPETLLRSVLLCAQRAAADAAEEAAWQANVLDELRRRSPEPAHELGKVLRPSDFGFAGEDLDEKLELRRAKREDVRRLRDGDVLQCTVKSHLPDQVVVALEDGEDLAYLPLFEISDPPPATTTILPKGQRLEVVVVRPSVGGTFAIVSLKRRAAGSSGGGAS